LNIEHILTSLEKKLNNVIIEQAQSILSKPPTLNNNEDNKEDIQVQLQHLQNEVDYHRHTSSQTHHQIEQLTSRISTLHKENEVLSSTLSSLQQSSQQKQEEMNMLISSLKDSVSHAASEMKRREQREKEERKLLMDNLRDIIDALAKENEALKSSPSSAVSLSSHAPIFQPKLTDENEKQAIASKAATSVEHQSNDTHTNSPKSSIIAAQPPTSTPPHSSAATSLSAPTSSSSSSDSYITVTQPFNSNSTSLSSPSSSTIASLSSTSSPLATTSLSPSNLQLSTLTPSSQYHQISPFSTSSFWLYKR
jgi:CHASE3 domain sensor protein